MKLQLEAAYGEDLPYKADSMPAGFYNFKSLLEQ